MKQHISHFVNAAILFVCLSLTFCVSINDINTQPESIITVISAQQSEKLAEYLFTNPETREIVVDFFTEKTGNRKVSTQILVNSIAYGVPADLAFAVAWKESRFDSKAYNKNSASIDRGIFQLNNRSFPWMKIHEFYNEDINIRHGIKYLKYCIENTDDEVVALAWYNAGSGRVKRKGAPSMTLYYISDIMDYREKIKTELKKKCLLEKNMVVAY
jgi:soluble lytic murein transglycosylase-like protein